MPRPLHRPFSATLTVHESQTGRTRVACQGYTARDTRQFVYDHAPSSPSFCSSCKRL